MRWFLTRRCSYNLGTLSDKIRELAVGGANEATITLALQQTDEYKQRFKANDARMEKGLRVLAPSEYLTAEDSYRQVLRTYGLTQFDSGRFTIPPVKILIDKKPSFARYTIPAVISRGSRRLSKRSPAYMGFTHAYGSYCGIIVFPVLNLVLYRYTPIIVMDTSKNNPPKIKMLLR